VPQPGRARPAEPGAPLVRDRVVHPVPQAALGPDDPVPEGERLRARELERALLAAL
jgi:hypothetical protein